MLWQALDQAARLAELTSADPELKEVPLRRDVRSLGRLLGEVLTKQAGPALFEAVEELRERAAATAKQTARELDREGTDGLDTYKKSELVDLAASIGIEKRTHMTKDELVEAIAQAARRRAKGGVRS